MTAETDIERCKAHFSRYGVPDVMISDNGRQFTGEEFVNFACNWDSEHITSSPYHGQSNVKAESALKIAKEVIKKARTSGQYVCKALWSYNVDVNGCEQTSNNVHQIICMNMHTALY